MFSRRHPFLFFCIIMAAMATAGLFMLTIMVSAIDGGEEQYSGEKVGVIEIAGPMTDSRTILHQIKNFRESDAIKAIVVRIDSPGGSVGPAQEIFREIRKTVPDKKVIASMGAVAASGGYYVAAGADGIMANPGTITGSIGVIMGYTNFEELLRKIGLSPVVIKSGEYKDIGSPVRPMTSDERRLLESITKKIHRQFVDAIVEGRRLERAKVEVIADGRILTGQEAHAQGLVDRLGNFEDAVQWAGELGGIKGEIETVFPEKEKFSLLRYLMESTLQLISKAPLQSQAVPEVMMRVNAGGAK